MPLHASSYFAGIGTVLATITLGFGAGVLMTDAFVGKSENPPTLAERRALPLSESSTPVVAAAPNPPALQTATAPQPDVAPVQASVPSLPHAQQPPRPHDDGIARARDDEVKKGLAAERRKEERRKWAERHKRELQKIEELNAVADKVRSAERERAPVIRPFFAESPAINVFADD